jgi:TRAP-type mannitol/chloroaromatic compound transport system permease large subunit
MTDPQVALLMLGAFIFIILLGFPIAFTLMAMGVFFGYYAYYQPDQAFFDNRVFYLLTQNTFSVMYNDVLTAIPLFLFMGYIVERSNILDRLFLSLQLAFRAVPGAMAIAALVTCAVFSGDDSRFPAGKPVPDLCGDPGGDESLACPQTAA